MKNKLVIWGTNAENEKVLIALELQADLNRVLMHTFPEAIADEAFVQKMFQTWRDEQGEVAFPEGVITTERTLSVTDGLLPDDLKVDRPDILQRAQTEWHFAVLSAKLHETYQQELAELKEKVASLSSFDNKIFSSLRTFWDKVQSQSRERNLYRQHADELRDGINVLFDEMKELRKRVNSEFMNASQSVYDGFTKALDDIEERIASGSAKFNSIFDELRKMQREYHNTRMSNEHRNKLWERLDGAFKKAKERKFGPNVNAGSVADRHDKRLSGLEDAIKRLEESLKRDDEELAFQRKKVNASEGQLEAQIRGAKIKMIEERANGKRERLAELTKARADVQRQATTAHEKEARIAAKEAERQQIEAKKAAIKSEIEAETHAKAEAAASQTPHEKEDSLFEAASNLLGDVLLDALDTAKAVAVVAAEKAGEALNEAAEKADEILGDAKEKATEAYAEVKEKAEETYEKVVEKAGAALESLKKDREGPTASVTANDTPGDSLRAKGKKAAEGKADGIIIDDVVHKSEEDAGALESIAAPESKADGIIIDDVVHRATEEGAEAESEPAAKPKRAAKKKTEE